MVKNNHSVVASTLNHNAVVTELKNRQ